MLYVGHGVDLWERICALYPFDKVLVFGFLATISIVMVQFIMNRVGS